ncbi:MAG TPA: hypothetical protein VNL16_05380 [Chloroflexota bacterium]|nr:hypothetical protein [Chloroflexota bacterium]
MHEAVVGDALDTSFSVSLVWIPMLESDNETAAREEATLFAQPMVRHFWDADRQVGSAVARSLGGPGDAACDIYLFFAPDIAWIGEPPSPTAWLHQLGDRGWADPGRYRTGADLVESLALLRRQLLGAEP